MRSGRADRVPVACCHRLERGASRVVSRFEVTPQQLAAWELQTAIRQVARDVHEAEIVEVPVEGYRLLTMPTLDDPLAGVRAAVLARDVAMGELLRYAEQA